MSLTQIGLQGMGLGALVAAAPVVATTALLARNLPAAILGSLLLRTATDGRWDTAFSVVMRSPALWKWTRVTCMIGGPIFLASAAVYATGCLTERSE